MSTTEIAATVCYGLVTLVAIAYGVIFLTRSKFMPHHSDALGLRWSELDPPLQAVLIGLMRAAGGGWLAVSLSLAFLLVFPFRAGEIWARYAIPLIGLAAVLPSMYAALNLRSKTPASPPVNVTIVVILILGLGFILSLV